MDHHPTIILLFVNGRLVSTPLPEYKTPPQTLPVRDLGELLTLCDLSLFVGFVVVRSYTN